MEKAVKSGQKGPDIAETIRAWHFVVCEGKNPYEAPISCVLIIQPIWIMKK
jgi:hypothetical protein